MEARPGFPYRNCANFHASRLRSPRLTSHAATVQPPCNDPAGTAGRDKKVPDIVDTWTGRHADALRRALRMTNEDFAAHLGVAVRTVAYWRSRPDMVMTNLSHQLLDTALAQAPERARAHLRILLDPGHRAVLIDPRHRGGEGGEPGRTLTGGSGASLTEWLTATSTSDRAIGDLDEAVAALARAHPHRAPAPLLTEAGHLQAGIQHLLRDGRLRHRQERELLRINGDLLAHMSLLFSDLDRGQSAREYGNAALLFLREAAATEAPAWYVLAKIARWRHHYTEAADLAAQGLEHSAADPMRVQLAWYEANAAALAGDVTRARTAMRQAEQAAAALPTLEHGILAVGIPGDRMTIFRVSVALHTGDTDSALRDAAAADATWSPGPGHNPGRLGPDPHRRRHRLRAER